MMTAGELIELLESVDPDTPVLVAHQPNWPFEYSIESAVEVTIPEDSQRGRRTINDHTPSIIYLEEGSQLGYLNEAAREELGW